MMLITIIANTSDNDKEHEQAQVHVGAILLWTTI